jgi:glycosyltransferase involved in cell wall biosynthesis
MSDSGDDMPARRILYVSPRFHSVPKSAGELRALRVANALQQIGRVSVLTVNSEEQREDEHDNTIFPIVGRLVTKIHRNEGLLAKARWLFDPRSREPHGVAVDSEGAARLRMLAGEYDLIWFNELRTANMFPDWAWQHSVVDLNDIPSLFEQSVLTHGISTGVRLATKLRVWSWQRRERLLDERFKVLAVCSEADRAYLQRLGLTIPVHVVANGYDRPTATPVPRLASPPRLGFIGVFDHAPNAAGVEWFVRYCWPLIKREIPDARFRLVGRLTDGPLKPTGQDVDALGYVEDADTEMSTWSAMVVPVLTGAGTRGKIAHAFSRKCPVVSTPLGAHGYDPRHGHDMLMGESPKAFAEACIRVIRDSQSASEMADRAWQRFLTNWTWEAVQRQVWAAAEQALEGSGAAREVFTDPNRSGPEAIGASWAIRNGAKP